MILHGRELYDSRAETLGTHQRGLTLEHLINESSTSHPQAFNADTDPLPERARMDTHQPSEEAERGTQL